MSTYYDCFAEAYRDGGWHGIDFYAKDDKGKLRPVPLLSGQSAVGEILDSLNAGYAGAECLSEETKQDHPYLTKEKEDDHYFTPPIMIVDGSEVMDERHALPWHAGFVPKDLVLAFRREEVEDIDDWLSPASYKELPKDVRKGYKWFEWTPAYHNTALTKELKDGLVARVNAYNESRMLFGAEMLTAQDCRIVVLVS